MKTTILSFIFILCLSCFLKAQEYQYVPLVQEDVTWGYYNTWQVGTLAYDTAYYRYQFEGDTIINATSYKKLYSTIYCPIPVDQRYIAAMREEDKKIFVIEDQSEIEILLYNFNLEEGDIIHGDFIDNTVTNIDFIEIDGHERKIFTFDGASQWIEGIGTIDFGRTFLNPFGGIPISLYTHLNYQKKGEEIIYKTEWFNEDECNTSAVNETNREDLIHVIFNQAENQFRISGLSYGKSYLFELRDLNGKPLIIKPVDRENNYLNIGNLIPGLYIYRLLDNVQTVLSGKVSLKF